MNRDTGRLEGCFRPRFAEGNMSYDIDGKPKTFRPLPRSRAPATAWDPHREYPEPEGLNTRDVRELIEERVMASAGFYRLEALLRVAREELAAAEAHLTLARQIKADGHDAHSVPYWEREVAKRREQVARLSACDQCGWPPARSPSRTAGDFCSCGAGGAGMTPKVLTVLLANTQRTRVDHHP